MFKKIFGGKVKWLTITVIIALVGITIFNFSKNNSNGFSVYEIKRGDISQEVTVSGIIKAQTDVDLAFERSGTVSYVSKSVNDFVYAGETIIALNNGSELAALNEAKAILASKKARFNELSTGSRPEEINIKELALQSEEQKLTNYYNSTAEEINNAFNYADSAINKQADDLFSNDNSTNPQLTFNVYDQQTKNDTLILRIEATGVISNLNSLNNLALGSILSKEKSEDYLNQTKNSLITIQGFLIKLTEALNKSSGLTDTTLASYKTAIDTGRTNVNTALQSITSLIENINSQKITVNKTKSELELLKLGATSDVLAQAESDILQAEAKIQSAEANLAKTIIKAPVSGIVSKIEAVKGELVQAGEVITTVIGNKNYIAEANLPENDLSKITTGDPVEITLDAFGEDKIFNGTLIQIEPAERIINGVSTYKIKVALDDKNDESQIKPGMTANIKIIVAKKEGVLIVPTSAVQERDTGEFLTIQIGKIQKEVSVETGIKSFGQIEILDNPEISEGTKIIVPTK